MTKQTITELTQNIRDHADDIDYGILQILKQIDTLAETNDQLIKELLDALKEYVYEEISSNAVKIIFDKKIDMTRVEKNLQLIE